MPKTASRTVQEPTKPDDDTRRSINVTEGTVDPDEPQKVLTVPPTNTDSRENTSTTALIEARVYSTLIDAVAINDLRKRLGGSTVALEKVTFKKTVAYDANQLGAKTNPIDELSTNVTELSDKLYSQVQQYNDEQVRVEQLEEAIKNVTEEHTERTVDMKVQVSFAKSVESKQIKTISTDATVDIIKDDDYVQKLGAELLNNEQDLFAINVAATRYVQAEVVKATAAISVLVSQGNSNTDAILTFAKQGMTDDIAYLFEQ